MLTGEELILRYVGKVEFLGIGWKKSVWSKGGI